VNTPTAAGQRNVWDMEYGGRGTSWGKQTLHLPEVLKGKRVLEAGVGNGKTLTAILRQAPEHVAAFDFSVQALGRCPECCADLCLADAERLPYRDGSFDAVVLYYILDNLLSDGRKTVVAEALRVLAPGGVALFEDFASGDFRERTAKTIGAPEPGTILKKKGLICHYFTEDEVRELFGGFGKAEVSVMEHNPIRNKDHLVRRTVRGVFTI
jgi:ubiquinone/menaquinone biosynthesis C-methylase UbiE